MSELSQAERIAALRANRGDKQSPLEPLTFAGVVDVTAAPSPVRNSRRPTISKPAPQRVVATGVSVVSFAAITMAMGPLTAQTVETTDGDDAEVDVAAVDPTIAQVPAAAPEVVVEVIPNYVAVSEDGTPLPAGTLRPDGTLATPVDAAPVELLEEEAQQVLAANAAEAGTVAAAAPAATAAPKAAAPAATAAPKAAAPAATAAPKAAAPAATAAPATAAPKAVAPAATAAPAPAATAAPATAAPATAPPATAAPAATPAPAATNPPPPPKSEASG